MIKLKKLVINGLFGHFNHEIKFKEGNITIITAPNGYGKTICLKILDAIFNTKMDFLSELQFSSIKLYSSNGAILIEKNEEDSSKSFTIYKGETKNDQENYTYSPKDDNFINDKIYSIIREKDLHLGNEQILESLKKDKLNERADILDAYLNFKIHKNHHIDIDITPKWLSIFRSSLNVHFIQDQRLIQRDDTSSHKQVKNNFVNTIEKYAAELATLIKESRDESGRISQRLDSSFPQRLLAENLSLSISSPDTLENDLKHLKEKTAKLVSYNLFATEHHPPNPEIPTKIKDEDRKALTLYVKDTKEKLSAYDDIHRKIEIFSRILNNNRLSFKKVKIAPDSGFYFLTKDERKLKLTQLSSGEQHQVVLLFELIFKTEANVLVLIDEPEISLHVAWQKEFLNDLKEIIEIQNMPVVIATHSPQIIGDNWDLTINLGKDD
ncbi:AAA family ATPase [Microbulbifer epialgicus]|uniref:AAA family ATPase n=1 Tax=Microbulbifer epialgicus TaxID=393907 RepID=A0ABV4NZA1_9GAMM